jgi:hypothetical protein
MTQLGEIISLIASDASTLLSLKSVQFLAVAYLGRLTVRKKTL